MEISSFQDDTGGNNSSPDIGVNAYGSIVVPDEEPDLHESPWMLKKFLAESVITLLGVFLSMATIHSSLFPLPLPSARATCGSQLRRSRASILKMKE